LKKEKCKTLVVVESAAKVKTINKFLGSNYQVESCLGHVRDLPKNELGVDVNNQFQPSYVLIPGRKKILGKLKKLSSQAEKIFLATDMDREGEAISWHLSQELNHKKQFRIVFNQITKGALHKAVENPGQIDINKVNAQQGRRVLDRLVGYKLSPLLWNKVKRGLSAGRVQSVAVRILCEREEEIETFTSEERWTLSVVFKNEKGKKIEAAFFHLNDKKPKINNEQTAKKIVEGIIKGSYKVSKIAKTQLKRSPYPPFTTSTLQQMASYYLRFSPSKTMKIAQDLYEGQEIGTNERVGLITYMRTDSTRIAKEAQVSARKWIKENLGKDFVPSNIPQYKNKKTSQDAHEAIRPTGIDLIPNKIKDYLSSDHNKLYNLIWQRFVASQMAKAIIERVSVEIIDTFSGGKKYKFKAEGKEIRFQGFLKVYQEKREKTKLIFVPEMEEALRIDKIISKQSFTQPSPRYTQATLVKALEEKGIGRPSTYAPIISTIQRRGYTRWVRGKLIPTSLARVVNTLLINNFASVIDADFTAKMEEGLDEVEQGKKTWTDLVGDFYQLFKQNLKEAEIQMKNIKQEGLEVSSLKCEKCGQEMLVKIGRFGQFLACSAYPECKNTKPLDNGTGVECPSSGCQGELVEKVSKKGRIFYACTRYPDCKFAIWEEPVKGICPHCGSSYLVRANNGGLKCPECGKNVKSTITQDISLNGVIHQIIKLRKVSDANTF